MAVLERLSEAARFDPEGQFETPARLAADSTLTPQQRMAALDRWEQSVQDRLAASNEGMPTNNTSGTDLDLLAKIELARRKLRSGRW